MIKQQDIADKLNISRTTVARALNGSSNIKQETKEKILKACEDLGYVKNPISSSLAAKRPKKVYAFIIKSRNIYYTEEIIKGLRKAEKESKFYGYDIHIIETDIREPKEQLEKLNRVIADEKPSGIIITPLLKKEIKEVRLKNPEIHFVTLDTAIDESITHIGVDYYKSGRIAADIFTCVINKGEKILVLDTVDDHISSKEYMNGFLDRMKEEKEDLIVGPIYYKDLKKDINKIIKENITEEVKGIYSTRFLPTIIEKIDKELSMEYKVIANGMSSKMKKLILEKKVLATIVEQWREEGYLAGKAMFEYLYKHYNLGSYSKIIEGRIIFRESLI